jgi:hypothetical protein
MRLQTLAWTILTAVVATSSAAQTAALHGQGRARGADYGKLPLTFEPNQGQTTSEVGFLSRGQGYTAFLTAGGMVLSLRPGSLTPAPNTSASGSKTVQLRLIGSAGHPAASGEDPQPGKANYFLGNDPTKWRTNVPTYGRVRYSNIYPGIDLVYYGNHRQLEYDFEVKPGSDPNKIQFEIKGASQIRLDEQGNLVLELGNGEIHFESPIVYQESHGQRAPVQGAYVLTDSTHIGFRVAHHDASKSLVIDPVLVYSSYLGGSGTDQSTGIAVDSNGSVYLVGYTNSTDFPLTTLGTPASNANHVFVAKLDPAGANLLYADYIGGNDQDYGSALALDGANNVYVTGSTSSSDFPAVKAYQSQQPGPYTGFVTKVSADGSSLLYSTYLGGNTFDQPVGIAVDSTGEVLVTGYTTSQDFPVANAYQAAALANEGGVYGTYGFLTKFSPDGSLLVYSTYLAGNSNVMQDCGGTPCWPAPYNAVSAIALDANGDAYVTGTTNTYNFPVTPSAFLASNSTQQDESIGFVTKISSAGSLAYSTYFYGSSGIPLQITAIAVDGTGSAYIAGAAESDGTFPITNTSICDPGIYGFACSYGFVTKFDPAGSTLLYSTFLGPNNYANPQAIALDAAGNAYVVSSASSPSFQTINAIEGYTNGADVLLVEIDPSATTEVFSTFLGGSGNDSASGLAVDAAGNIYIAGSTSSDDFPVTPGAFQRHLGGGTDAFVLKIGPGSTPAVTFNPNALLYSSEPVGTSSPVQEVLLRNVSSSPLAISSIAVTGDYSETDYCGTSLPPAGSCTLSVAFTPTAPGSRYGLVTISDDAQGSPQVISLTGTGLGPAAFLNPATPTFPSEPVGVSSTAQIVTLTNQGNGALMIANIQITGDFAQTNNCPASVAANASCTFNVVFTPTATGTRSGTLTITDNASGSPHSVALSGTGLGTPAVALSPATPTFPSEPVGVSSTAQIVTLTNQGNGALTIANIQITGDFAQTNNCPASVAANASCTFNVVFTPTATGTRSGTLTITDNASGSPHSVVLSGTGNDFTIAISPTSETVKASATATYTLTVSPVGGAFNGAIQLACSGAPTQAICSVSPTAVTPGAKPGTVTVSISTRGSSAAANRLMSGRQQPIYAVWMQFQGLGLMGMLLAGSRRGRKKISTLIVLALLIAGVLFMSACAGGTGIAQQGGPKTDPGTYTLTVTGTSGALQHSVSLTLIVQ